MSGRLQYLIWEDDDASLSVKLNCLIRDGKPTAPMAPLALGWIKALWINTRRAKSGGAGYAMHRLWGSVSPWDVDWATMGNWRPPTS